MSWRFRAQCLLSRIMRAGVAMRDLDELRGTAIVRFASEREEAVPS
jgi:hypothetical protein